MRHGQGRFEDGTECYDGEWADDKMHGQGRLAETILLNFQVIVPFLGFQGNMCLLRRQFMR